MIKKVKNVSLTEILKNKRFDGKYYYLGEVLNKTLSRFETQSLVSFTKFIRKGIFDLNSKYYRKEGIPFIRISNLKSFSIDENGLTYIPIENHKNEIKTKLVPSDLALSKIGKYLGKVGAIPSRYPEVNISQNIIGVAFNCEEYLRKYIFLYLTTPLAINQILRVSKAHNQNKLTLPDIRTLKIPQLSKQEMRYYGKIVNELAILENESFKLVKEAQYLFCKKLNTNFNKIKKEFCFTANLKSIRNESFFTPEFSNPIYSNAIKMLDRFESKPLGGLVKPFKGSEVGSENYNLYVSKIESDVPFIRTSDVVNYEIDNYPDFYIANEIFKDLKQELKPLDIIFSKDGSVGNVAMITKEDRVIISSGFLILRTNKELNVSPYYIFCALSIPEIGGYQAKKRTVVASTIPHLRKENLLKIRIPILDESTREEISIILKQAFDKKTERKQLLDCIKKELETKFEVSNDN